jgi:hypothetical protein
MPFVFKRLALLLSITAAFAADKQPPPFKPGPAESFANHQTNDKVTVGADPYMMGEKVKAAFGKIDPYQFGILPVLVVIQNSSDASIKLDRIRVEYVGPSHDRVYATPARDVRYSQGTDRPKAITGPPGMPSKVIKKKNPLDAWEIEGRAFAAQMLAPGQTASGFFYFQTGLQRGATIYLTGMTEAASGRELVFFELPLSADSPDPGKVR